MSVTESEIESTSDHEVWMASITYQFDADEIETTLSSIGDLNPWHTLHLRLDGPEVDQLQERRPESYAEGWHHAADDVERSDSLWDTPRDSDEDIPPTYADLADRAEADWQRARRHRKNVFLRGEDFGEADRRELWHLSGRTDCLDQACELCRVDDELTSPEIADALRKHDSVPAMREYIRQTEQTIEADRRHFVACGGQL